MLGLRIAGAPQLSWVKTSTALWLSIVITAGIALLLLSWLFTHWDHFLESQQAMFDAMMVMAEMCRL